MRYPVVPDGSKKCALVATKDLMKNKTSKAILNQFMRGRNLMNVIFVVKCLMKNKTSKAILKQFMREET